MLVQLCVCASLFLKIVDIVAPTLPVPRSSALSLADSLTATPSVGGPEGRGVTS